MDKPIKKRLKHLEIQKYHHHKAIFKIADNDVLALFEKLLYKSDNFMLEPSFKIKDEEVFSSRFIITWRLNKDFLQNINPILDFFKQLSKRNIRLNYNLIKRININKINVKKIEEIIVGIDLRNKFCESRIKFYVVMDGYPELFNQILKMHGYNSKVIDLIYSSALAVGFDFYFNGKTRSKIYVPLDSSHLDNFIIQKKLNKIFSPKINYFLSKSNRIYVSFKGSGFKKTLYFYPKNPKSFINLLNNKKLKEIYSALGLKNKDYYYIVALMEDEINKNCLRNINFYYS